MKKFWMFSTLLLVLAVAAAAQTSAGAQSSTNANTGASAGQQGASANAGVANDTNASANPQGGSSSSATTTGTGISSNSNLASGTTILATLNKSVDAKKVKQGDEIDARAAQNVVSNGSVVIPRGSKLIGHVTEVKAREKGQNESSLGIAFDKAVLKNGQEVPLQASIRAIAAAPNNSGATNSPMADMGGMDSASSTSGDVGPRTGGVGGATGPVGSTAGTVGNTAGNVGSAAGGAVNSTVSGAGRTAGNATGELATNSQGVVGLQGLTLNSQAGTAASGSIITSTTKNVKLDSGTQLVLQVTR
jgi:hypothetical protein